jgi:hypothetical protein
MKVNYPETILSKSQGSNNSEIYLSRLCNDTFLSLWSYPNLFRDQGRTISSRADSKGDGKELCDLLVVFDNHVIIFSDKKCAFSNNGDIQIDWIRWYKKAVRSAADQIWGAERWITKFSNTIFLDKNCIQSFPLEFPPPERVVFHRIVVTHGISEICKKYIGGSGSFRVCPQIIGNAHHSTPFTIGKIDDKKGYVHVFDDNSLEVVMKTLDTISDFVRYLTQKEDLIENGKLMTASGEDDLLAHYLQNIDENKEHTFFPKSDEPLPIKIAEGIWNDFCKHPSRLAQIKANEISYSWDKLIEKFIFHITTGTSYQMSHPNIKSQEEVLRFLAKENRTRRRLLAISFNEFIHKTPEKSRGTRIVKPSFPGEPYYLFLLLPRPKSVSDEVYRKARSRLLEGYLYILKLDFSDAVSIIGLATETKSSAERSEDFMYLDASGWAEEENEIAKSFKREFVSKGYLVDRTMYIKNIKEYPDVIPEKIVLEMKGKVRNMPCPCNSGKKIKNCCGKN